MRSGLAAFFRPRLRHPAPLSGERLAGVPGAFFLPRMPEAGSAEERVLRLAGSARPGEIKVCT
jgi:hypothetical protein